MEFGDLIRLGRREAKGLTHTSPGQRPGNKQRILIEGQRPVSYRIRWTLRVGLTNLVGWHRRLVAVGRWIAPLALGHASSRTCSWGVAPGWYDLTPLASPGAFNSKCPISSAGWKPALRHSGVAPAKLV